MKINTKNLNNQTFTAKLKNKYLLEKFPFLVDRYVVIYSNEPNVYFVEINDITFIPIYQKDWYDEMKIKEAKEKLPYLFI